MQVAVVPGGPVMTNCFLAADEAGVCVVIDPGYEPERLPPMLQQLGWTVAAVVATHGHFDHVAGNYAAQQLWGVPLWMHPAAVPSATTASQHARWFGLSCADSPPPDRTFEHGDTFTVGSLQFEVRHTPGHCPGNVALYTPGHVFVGDVLFAGSIGRYDLPGSDYDTLMRSIAQQLMTLPDETVVYPGHGEATSIGEERRHNPFAAEWAGQA
ncbi:MAG: MBL fold metallo-hydrolase [Fimbriimonadaceae bacterium]|nr:MBL fold metallo-hydrolase [Fimbriimonadaceae bacterium]